MDNQAIIDEIKHTLTTSGWRYLKIEFNKKKESIKNLLMDTDLDTVDGKANARKYQAMFNAIEGFEDNVRDILANLEQ